MSRITAIFWLLIVGLTAFWVAADPVVFGRHPFAQFQFAFVNYTGIIAMATMAVSLLLALRTPAIEPYLGGLDKSYRLHKWLGVAALVMIIAHWTSINSASWLQAVGLIAAPARGAAQRQPTGPAFLRATQGPARTIGSWCFYAGVLLLVLALVKWFPYRHFIRTHKLLAVVYLLLVFHSAVLLKTAYWTHWIAYLLTALMAAGTVAAVYTLVRKVGRTRQAVGRIEKVSLHQDGRIVGVTVAIQDSWPGHDAGQFAFVRFDHDEPHPFTISSAWMDDGLLTFHIKALGDYTSALPQALEVGSLVTIEGPYGRFTFDGKQRRQIWISAGIGITPFISRMQDLAKYPDRKKVDLFHATARRDDAAFAQLRRLASAANVRLHLWVGEEEGRLTAEQIREGAPDWQEADIWFCGPVDFGKALRKNFIEAGAKPRAFHQELFHLR